MPFSPDGKRLAYVTADGARNLHVAVRRLEDAKGRVLAGTEGGEIFVRPFPSAASKWQVSTDG